MNEKLFHENLEKWSHVHPKEAVMLPYIECDDVEFCKTKRGELNLKRDDYYYHSKEDAKKEAEAWFSKLDLSKTEVLYVFGVGLGYYLEPTKKWLEESPKHQLVFLEDDRAVLHRLFETDRGAEILDHPQIHLYFFKSLDETEPVFVELYWNFVMTRMQFSALHLYEQYRAQMFSDLAHKISYDAALKNSLLDEYLRHGYSFFRNYYSNLSLLPKAALGNGFFGKFKGVPAIICGAGPSLQKNLPLLKTLQEHALIFAGSSAINAVTTGGVKPHFGAGIDPNPSQYSRLKQVKDLDFPFFYRNRWFHPATELVKGTPLYITGSGGYDISEFFEKELGIEGELIEEGKNVVNFCLEIAHKMGCNPIIFVGMDLAYTEMKRYSPGVKEDPTVSEKRLLESDDFDERAIERKDIHRNTVYTLWKWLAESKWISDFAEENPKITVINATEGGLGFEGVPNLTLKEVSETYLKEESDLRSQVQKIIDSNRLDHITQESIIAAMQQLRKSLLNCIKLIDTLIEESNRVKTAIEKEKRDLPIQTTKTALAETEIAEEPGFAYVLDIFSAASSKLLGPELKKVDKSHLPEWEKTMRRLTLTLQKYTFLKVTAEINANLIQDTLDGKVKFPKKQN